MKRSQWNNISQWFREKQSRHSEVKEVHISEPMVTSSDEWQSIRN